MPVVRQHGQHLDEQAERQDPGQDRHQARDRGIGHVADRAGVAHHDDSAATRFVPAAGTAPGQLMVTSVPWPGADRTDARPPQSVTRSVIERRSPSRAGSTRAGSKPAPASRTVTQRARPQGY